MKKESKDNNSEANDESGLYWFETGQTWHPIDTYFELMTKKSFKVKKIVNWARKAEIEREIAIIGRSQDEIETDIANKMFFGNSDAKVASGECSICQQILNTIKYW